MTSLNIIMISVTKLTLWVGIVWGACEQKKPTKLTFGEATGKLIAASEIGVKFPSAYHYSLFIWKEINPHSITWNQFGVKSMKASNIPWNNSSSGDLILVKFVNIYTALYNSNLSNLFSSPWDENSTL